MTELQKIVAMPFLAGFLICGAYLAGRSHAYNHAYDRGKADADKWYAEQKCLPTIVQSIPTQNTAFLVTTGRGTAVITSMGEINGGSALTMAPETVCRFSTQNGVDYDAACVTKFTPPKQINPRVSSGCTEEQLRKPYDTGCATMP